MKKQGPSALIVFLPAPPSKKSVVAALSRNSVVAVA
jgi:hypothetical protein